MTFEKHHRLVSRAASQKLSMLRNSWRVFYDRSLIGRCFRGFVMSVLEHYSAVWCSAADTHLKLLDRAVIGARFLTGCVYECDISHRQSVAVMCICCIRSGVTQCTRFPGPYVTVRVTRGALVAHRYTYASLGCRTSQYRRTFVLRNDLSDPVFDGVGLAGFKSRANAFLLA